MTKVTTVLILSAALLLFLTTAYANVDKEKELAALNQATDVSPYKSPVGPVAPSNPGIDAQWDMLYPTVPGDTLDVATLYMVGCEFVGGQLFVTAGISNPCSVFVYDWDGVSLTYNTQFAQWSTGGGWGWRDLAWDGTYLYGSDDYVVDQFLPDGTMGPSTIPSPVSPARALAYDPTTDSFWTASFSSALYNFDRTGLVLSTTSLGLTGQYGAAWDNETGMLWIHDQTYPGGTGMTLVEFDPVGLVLTGVFYDVPLLPGYTTQGIAGGLAYTHEWSPLVTTLVGFSQGAPDRVFALEMYAQGDPLAPAAPDNFTATADPGGALSCDLAWDLPTTTINGSPIGSYPITSVEIMRDGAPLATLAATATSYTDSPPAVGNYAYSVYCVNSYGDGLSANASAWVGLDVPNGVENLTGAGVGQNLEVNLSWDNPTTGYHGGYFPLGSIDEYTINRYGPDPGTFNLIGIATSYYDNTMSVQGWYEYGVIASNSSGDGPEVLTGEFYVGPPEFEEITYAWIEINPTNPGYDYLGTTSGLTGDDETSVPFTLGFNFSHYGNTYGTIMINTNGYCSFSDNYPYGYSNQPIPSTAQPNDMLCPYQDDLNISGTNYGSIWYYADPGGQFFVIEYDSCNHYGSAYTGEYFTFEAIIYPNGDVDYMYKAIVPGTLTPFPQASVGKENIDGTVGVQVTYNGSGPFEPTSGTGVRIYGGAAPTPDFTVTLTYNYGSPVPAGGGAVNFDVFLQNNELTSQNFDLWIEIPPQITPPGVPNRNLTFPGGFSIFRPRMDWPIPASWPAGNYTMDWYIGDMSTWTAWASDSFPFVKSADDDGSGYVLWEVDYDPLDQLFEGIDMGEIANVSEFALLGTYPNPFNPSATISYVLPEASKVTLTVYDINGRQVAELVNGWRDMGVQEAVFDASNLASGVYIYNLTAGTFNATGKMVMMK